MTSCIHEITFFYDVKENNLKKSRFEENLRKKFVILILFHAQQMAENLHPMSCYYILKLTYEINEIFPGNVS